MTALSTYQSLALSEQAALSLRKHAARRLLAFEQACDEQAQGRRDTLALMHRDGPGRRDALVGTVNATSDSQGASERERIADSFDARPAAQRAVEREYGLRTFKLDVRQGRSPAAKCGPCSTARLPQWALALPASEQRKLEQGRRHFADPSDERDERTAKRATSRDSASAAYRDRLARLQALATTSDETHRA